MTRVSFPRQIPPIVGKAWRNWVDREHDYKVDEIKYTFLYDPPQDEGIYVYTYYAAGFDCPDIPIYHGFTTNAPKRAADHLKHAPWAGWVDYVRYRECRTVPRARKLERRLQTRVDSLCHDGLITRTYWGDPTGFFNERDTEAKVNHLSGHCRLPGGWCDYSAALRRYKEIEAEVREHGTNRL